MVKEMLSVEVEEGWRCCCSSISFPLMMQTSCCHYSLQRNFFCVQYVHSSCEVPS